MAYIILESDIITLEGPHSSDSKATHEYRTDVELRHLVV